MFHEGGVVYHMLTVDGTIRTKHVTFRKEHFPGTKVWDNAEDLTKTDSDSDRPSEISAPSGEFWIPNSSHDG